MGVAVDVPSLLILCVVKSYPGISEKLFSAAPGTASPRVLYFSSPSNGGSKSDCLPRPLADPIQKIPLNRAGKEIG